MVCVAGVDGMEGMGWMSGMGGGSGVDKKITIPPCPCLSRQGCFQSCRALGPYLLAHLRDFLLMLGEQIRQREKRGRWERERKREWAYLAQPQGWPDCCANLLSEQ